MRRELDPQAHHLGTEEEPDVGNKGARGNTASAAMAARLREELAPLGPVSSKPMFGGHGIFCDGVMFALVDTAGTPFLRTYDDDAEPPVGAVRHGRMPYWSVGDDLLARPDELLERARASLRTARDARR